MDTLLSKCFGCSKLGQNDPTIKTTMLALSAVVFIPSENASISCIQLLLTINIAENESSGESFYCFLYNLSKHSDTFKLHCGLDRAELIVLHIFKATHFINFQFDNSNIPNYSILIAHFDNYF